MNRVAAGNSLDEFGTGLWARLGAELGERFELLSQAPVPDPMVADADAVLRDRETGKFVLVEVKGFRPSEDLSLATIPFIRRMKQAISPYEIVVLSRSAVPELVRSSLAASHVPVVEATPGRDIVPELAAAISGVTEARG